MYGEGVKRHSKYAVRAHNIFAHNFFKVQPIFNLKKVLKSWDFGLSNRIKCYVCWNMSKGSKVEIFIIHVDGFQNCIQDCVLSDFRPHKTHKIPYISTHRFVFIFVSSWSFYVRILQAATSKQLQKGPKAQADSFIGLNDPLRAWHYGFSLCVHSGSAVCSQGICHC